MFERGRLAGDNPVMVLEQQRVNPHPLQQMQSLSLSDLADRQIAEKTPYSPFGKYPVSDGLIDFGEPSFHY